MAWIQMLLHEQDLAFGLRTLSDHVSVQLMKEQQLQTGILIFLEQNSICI